MNFVPFPSLKPRTRFCRLSSPVTPFVEGRTWEDWDAYVRQNYPIRYFFWERLFPWFGHQWRRLERSWYWLKCCFLPSYQYHKLDLRGIDPLEPKYTHGYLSPCDVLWLSAWASLRLYVLENPRDLGLVNEPELVRQKAEYDEAMALYHWWTVERVEAYKEERHFIEEINKHRDAREKLLYEQALDAWHAYQNAQTAKEDEMLQRLIKIRRSLWT